MIVNTGKQALLSSQISYFSGLRWGLFTNNVVVGPATVFANLVEASWPGYARVILGSLGPVTVVADKAQMQPVSQPTFGNTGSSSATFYGWFLLDATGPTLVAAVNLGATVLPVGSSFPLSSVLTDDTG